MLIDYYNMPSDRDYWSEDDKRLFKSSCKNYHELKIRLSRDLPNLYRDVVSRINTIKVLDEDIEVAIILAMSNKLSHNFMDLHITLLMDNGEFLRPEVIGYYYHGVADFR